jgi:hypothetical protein
VVAINCVRCVDGLRGSDVLRARCCGFCIHCVCSFDLLSKLGALHMVHYTL